MAYNLNISEYVVLFYTLYFWYRVMFIDFHNPNLMTYVMTFSDKIPFVWYATIVILQCISSIGILVFKYDIFRIQGISSCIGVPLQWLKF